MSTREIRIEQPCTGRRSVHILLESAGRISRLNWATITGKGFSEVTLEHRGDPEEMEEIALAFVRNAPERITDVTLATAQ